MQHSRKVTIGLQYRLAICFILLFVVREPLAAESNEITPSPKQYADHNIQTPDHRLEIELSLARNSFEDKDYETCLLHLSAIEASPGFKVMPNISKSKVWKYGVFAYTELMRYSHAVLALKAYADLEDASTNIITNNGQNTAAENVCQYFV